MADETSESKDQWPREFIIRDKQGTIIRCHPLENGHTIHLDGEELSLQPKAQGDHQGEEDASDFFVIVEEVELIGLDSGETLQVLRTGGGVLFAVDGSYLEQAVGPIHSPVDGGRECLIMDDDGLQQYDGETGEWERDDLPST